MNNTPGIIDPWAEQPDAASEAQTALASAAPQEVQAQRDLLGTLLSEVAGQQGVDPQTLAHQFGTPTADTNALGMDDLVRLTINLARQHPELVALVAQRFPQAQALLGMLLGAGGGGLLGGGNPYPQQNDGGGLGGLLGGVLGSVLGGRR